jgi:hypothetical protein
VEIATVGKAGMATVKAANKLREMFQQHREKKKVRHIETAWLELVGALGLESEPLEEEAFSKLLDSEAGYEWIDDFLRSVVLCVADEAIRPMARLAAHFQVTKFANRSLFRRGCMFLERADSREIQWLLDRAAQLVVGTSINIDDDIKRTLIPQLVLYSLVEAAPQGNFIGATTLPAPAYVVGKDLEELARIAFGNVATTEAGETTTSVAEE